MNEEKFYIDDLAPIRAFCLNSDKEDVYKYIYYLQQKNQEYRKKYEMAVADYEYEASKIAKAIELIEEIQNFPHTNINQHKDLKELKEILKGDNKED